MSQEAMEAATEQAGADLRNDGQYEQNMFADNITEEMLGRMLGGGDDREQDDSEQDEQAEPEKAGADEQGEKQPVEPEKAAAEEEKPADSALADDWEIPLFGKTAKLSGDQLCELAEAGAQFIQFKPQVGKAMQLMEAVQSDPQLLAILQAYSEGKPLPQAGFAPAGGPAAPIAPSGQTASSGQTDPLAQIREMMRAQLQGELVPQLVPQLKQQLMAEIEQHYQPFVESVNSFAAEQRREKAFGKYAADPEYTAVNDLMQRNLQAKVADGTLNYEQAARVEAALKSDPKLYGEWFGQFKGALASHKATRQGAGQGMGQGMGQGDVRTVTRAPRLEGAAALGDDDQQQYRQRLTQALGGDPVALGSLL